MSKTRKQIQRGELHGGFGIIEVVVSILLLGLLGMILAGGLTQLPIANSKNILVASASQIVTEEAIRIQGSVSNCVQLNTLLESPTSSTQIVLGESKIIEVSSEKIGWANCGEISTGAYPIRLSATSDGVTLFSADSLVVLK